MFSRPCIVATVLVSIISVALAGSPEPRSGAAEPLPEKPALPFVTLMIARDPAVHAELHLTRKQIDEVTAAVAEVDQSFWVLRDVPIAKCGRQLDALLGQLRQHLQEALTAGQLRRLDQVALLQARGLKALVSTNRIEQLHLSEEQVSKLREILESPEQQTTAGKSADSASHQVLAILSKEQSVRLAEITGKRFDLSKVLQIGCVAPELRGVEAWINCEFASLESLRGKVVAVHFWTFGCINCIHNLPHYQKWHETFPTSELTIIGIHTPETTDERKLENVRESIRERKIKYPVAVDGAAKNWKAWGNDIWPAVYLIDKQGRVRYWWYGEMNWQGAKGEEFMRNKIQELIAEK